GAVCPGQTLRMRAHPIVVFDRRLDAAVLGNIDAHPDQRLARIAQELQVFVRRAFPEVDVEKLVLDDGRACGEIDDLGRHWTAPHLASALQKRVAPPLSATLPPGQSSGRATLQDPPPRPARTALRSSANRLPPVTAPSR